MTVTSSPTTVGGIVWPTPNSLRLTGNFDSKPTALPVCGLAGAGLLHLEGDWLGDAVHRQVAGDVVGVAVLGDLRADEFDRRVLRGAEEAGALEVVVAALVAGVDAGDLDREVDLDLGRVGVPGDRAGDVVNRP